MGRHVALRYAESAISRVDPVRSSCDLTPVVVHDSEQFPQCARWHAARCGKGANSSLYLLVGRTSRERGDVLSATARSFLRSIRPHDSVGVAGVFVVSPNSCAGHDPVSARLGQDVP